MIKVCEKIAEYLKNKSIYQTFTYGGLELNRGLRANERRKLIDLNDIRNKNVLDLGCATGAECMWAVENGAARALGIDINDDNILMFNHIIEILNEDSFFGGRVGCMKYDLNNHLPSFAIKFNTVFCFAITQYIQYRRIWNEVPGQIVVYVEGGADSNYTEESLTDERFVAKFLGHTPSNREDQRPLRPFFRLTTR